MVIKSAELETVCGITSKLPENTFPEIAFAGKSNVGKSSLINALMNRPERHRRSTSTISTRICILLICPVMAMRKYRRKSVTNGAR